MSRFLVVGAEKKILFNISKKCVSTISMGLKHETHK